jgi:hypothetical protein
MNIKIRGCNVAKVAKLWKNSLKPNLPSVFLVPGQLFMLAQLKIRTFCYGVLNLKNTKLKKKTCFIWRSFQLAVLKIRKKEAKTAQLDLSNKLKLFVFVNRQKTLKFFFMILQFSYSYFRQRSKVTIMFLKNCRIL